MIEPDKSILQEHAFYESGNLKLLLPLMKMQNYDAPADESISDFNSVGVLGLIVVVAVVGFLYYRRPRSKKAVSIV